MKKTLQNKGGLFMLKYVKKNAITLVLLRKNPYLCIVNDINKQSQL